MPIQEAIERIQALELEKKALISEKKELSSYIAEEEQKEEEFFEELDTLITNAEDTKGFWLFRFVAAFNAAILVFKKIREFMAYRRAKKEKKSF